jgi:hypothetical protein
MRSRHFAAPRSSAHGAEARRTPAVRTADDVRLFILDDGGVLLVSTTQELCLFNTAATFIWCCLADGQDEQQIVTTYADGFAISTADARQQVLDALAQWQGLGYIDGYTIPDNREQPLLQAVARLLVNESLRNEFERCPQQVAVRLGVGQDEQPDFLMLDASGLKKQADLLKARQTGIRHRPPATASSLFTLTQPDGASLLNKAARAALREPSASVISARYRMLDTIICLRFSSNAEADRITPVVAHLACEDPGPAHCILDFLEIDDGGHVMIADGVPVEYCSDIASLAPLVKTMIRGISTDRHKFLFEIHAGVVAAGDHCLLLPGAPGRGKTTLTAALVCAGFRYFSDEVALLEEPDCAVRSFPLSLGIKPGAVEVLATRYPAIRQLDVHAREDEQRVRYLPPLGYDNKLPMALPVRWIVFPNYDPHAETRLKPISRTDALRRLMSECMVLPELLDESRVHAMVRWLRNVECMELPMSSLDGAVDVIQNLCRAQPAATARSL